MRVLMVEDAVDLAETVVARFSQSGIVCDHAASVSEAEPARESTFAKVKRCSPAV